MKDEYFGEELQCALPVQLSKKAVESLHASV